MKNLLKYIGSLILFIGVLIIAIPEFMHQSSNTSLITGLILVIVGFVLHIVLNRKAGEN